jgi:FkbM family methyltransferase
MLDVGANLGYFSLLWASVNPNNRVVAFEASPRNVPLLRRNVERNSCGQQVQIAALAVGKEHGTVAFELGPDDQTGWGGIALAASANAVTVEVVRIDDFIAEIEEDIALLKIDIEGADTWALIGCERLLRARRIREIWFEANKPRMHQLGIAAGAATELLCSLGYSVSRIRNSPELLEWRAVPKE